MFKKLNFKTRILIVMLTISSFALIFFGISASKSLHALKEGKQAQISAASESIIDKIDRNLFERYGDVQAFAMSEPARSLNHRRITDFMNDMMGTYAPVYDIMMVVNASGKVVAVNQVDKKGQALASRELIGKDFSGENWFKEVMAKKLKAGEAFVEGLHVDSDVAAIIGNNGRVMNFSAPIIDKATGAIIGVWSNRMSWQDVVLAIAQEESAKIKSERITDVFAYLMDASGNYMIHPNGEKFELSQKHPNFESESAQAKDKPSLLQRDLKETFFSGSVFEVMAKSKGYGSYPSQGWYMVMQVPEADATSTATLRLIFGAIIVLLLVNIVGFKNITSLGATFEKIIVKIDGESKQVRESATDITGASRNLAEAATQQASALQETAASIEETNAMIKKSSENANRSQEVSAESQTVAERGKQSVSEVIFAIEDINRGNQDIVTQINESNRQISDIVKLIGEIESKTKVINDIVFQTKLLSFNASVEAARAGEHGKGFAVVAEEVGNLAQMSGNAAKEISDMLAGSVQKVEGIVNDTKHRVESLVSDTKQKVEHGTEVARRCGDVIDEIVSKVENVNRMIGEISSASKEQTIGIGEITKAMNELDQVTQENAATSEQVSGSAEKLSGQADSLFGVVMELREVVQGSNATKAAKEPAASERRRTMRFGLGKSKNQDAKKAA